jgi:hypothetical protein
MTLTVGARLGPYEVLVELWKELIPPDLAGANVIPNVQIAPDGNAYAYYYGQVLSDLYLVEGLE